MRRRSTAAGCRCSCICARDVSPDALARIDRALAAGPRADLAAISARLAAGQPAIQRASWGAYDQFLKANRVAEGVRSYDEVVTLVLGTRLKTSTAGPLRHFREDPGRVSSVRTRLHEFKWPLYDKVSSELCKCCTVVASTCYD